MRSILLGVTVAHTSKSLFWPEVIMLAANDMDLMQSASMTIGVHRQTEMNSITIVLAGINDHFRSRGFLSRLREPTMAKDAEWPAKKDILESMGEIMERRSICVVSGICTYPGWIEVCVRNGGTALRREV